MSSYRYATRHDVQVVFSTALRQETAFRSKGALLIGTSLKIENSSVAVSRKSATPVDKASGNLQGILSDLDNMRKCFLDTKYIQVYDVWSQRRDEGKKEMLQAIEKFFQEEYDRYILYYSGHGTRDGNWAIGRTDRSGKSYEEVVTLENILSLWIKSNTESQVGCFHRRQRPAHLIIIADSCHSGAWADEINVRLRDDVMTNVSMIASCKANEICTDSPKGGDFTTELLRPEVIEQELSFTPVLTEDLVFIHNAGRHGGACAIL